MSREKCVLLPTQERRLESLGQNFRVARLRRNLSTEQVAERAGIGRSTLVKVERGDAGVAIGIYLKVLSTLGLESELSEMAADRELSKRFEQARLSVKQRVKR